MNRNYPKIPITSLSLLKATLLCLLIGSVTLVIGGPLDTNGQPALSRKLSLQIDQAELKNVLQQIEE
jgi:hypothetical protein